jgi:hypothetical protein
MPPDRITIFPIREISAILSQRNLKCANEKFESSRLPNNNDLAAPTQIGRGPGAIAPLAKPPVDRASRTATHHLSGEHSLLREQ